MTRSATCAVVVLLGGGTALAQSTYEVAGNVRDSDGSPVAGAVVSLAGQDGGSAWSATTDPGGHFRFAGVPAGRIELSAEARGLHPLHRPLDVAGDVRDLELRLESRGQVYQTVIHAPRSELPAQDGTSTTTITHADVQDLPGGTSRSFNDVVAMTGGVTPDNFGAIHVRGNFAGLLLRIDGVQLPPAIQDRLQQLLEPQLIEVSRVIVGGLPAEFGEDVAGVVDVETRHPTGLLGGEAQLLYGTYNHVQGQANAAGSIGPLSAMVAGSGETTDRGLDPPAASPILHDQLHDGRLFLRLEDDPTSRDRIELLGLFAQSAYQLPIDPTLLPLSDAPPGAIGRGVDSYGNTAPVYVPPDSNPTESEQEVFAALSWFHDFGSRTHLQVAPFFRYEDAILSCDVVHQLGPAADPGTTCSDLNHAVSQGGVQVSETFGSGPHDFKAGLLLDDQRSTVAYTQFTRDDSSPMGGADPALTLSGLDHVDVLLAGIYLQDRITLGKLTLFPGLRLDFLRAGEEGTRQGSVFWGPSARLGAAYAFTEQWVVHAYVGNLFQPPSYDAPAAARVLGLVPAGQPVPFDLEPELDYYAEVGLAGRIIPQWTASLTVWGRLSQHTLDDNEVGDTALTADYNYGRGRAAGVELAANVVVGRNLRGFANVSAQVAQGEGIASARYLFTAQQLAFAGFQSVDNTQLLTANAGFDLSDTSKRTHLSALVRFGSGLRTGPTNNATLPPDTVIDATLRHSFGSWPFKPEIALDVLNMFDVVYAYRIATGSLAGTAYGPLRQIQLRVSLPFGS